MEMTWELVNYVFLTEKNLLVYISHLFLTAVFPLSLAVSSLSPGDNEVVVSLGGSGGSSATTRFTITLGKHVIAA